MNVRFAMGVCLVLAGGNARAADAGVSEGATFESVAMGAQAVTSDGDWQRILDAAIGACENMPELEARQCKVMRAWNRREVTSQSYIAYGDEVALVVGKGGERQRVIESYPCVRCARPIDVAGAGRFFVVGGAPKIALPAAAKTMRALGIAAHAETVQLGADVDEAKWDEEVAPRLRTQIAFRLGDRWKVGSSEGVQVRVLGQRVVDGCTGQVLWSEPPSAQPAARVKGLVCPKDTDPEEIARRKQKTLQDRPERLSKDMIEPLMNGIRTGVRTCVIRHAALPATVSVSFYVAASGVVDNVVVEKPPSATGDGAPFTACVTALIEPLQFPPFKMEKQRVGYAFALR